MDRKTYDWRTKKLTKQQAAALRKLYRRAPQDRTFLEFRRTVKFYRDFAAVYWCGMFVGIEPDGYTHT